ncbi:MAG: hypothetical protein U0L93_05945 [Bacteroidales bacterium]|nr:hypothetical protein [Bacteroidales bacterium]
MANRQFFVDLDLNLNQLLEVRVENLSTTPTATEEQAGRIIYNTQTKILQFCTGTAWITLPSSLTLNKATNANGETEYTFMYNGSALGEKIVIPKDKVVQSGELVSGTWAGNSFTPSPTGTGEALKLTIANSNDVVYVNLEKFNISTGSLTVTLTTPTASSTQATAGAHTVQALSQIIVNNIAYLMNAVPDAVRTSILRGKSGKITTNFKTGQLVLMQAYQVTKDNPALEVELQLSLDSSNNILWATNSDISNEQIFIIAHCLKGRTLTA